MNLWAVSGKGDEIVQRAEPIPAFPGVVGEQLAHAEPPYGRFHILKVTDRHHGQRGRARARRYRSQQRQELRGEKVAERRRVHARILRADATKMRSFRRLGIEVPQMELAKIALASSHRADVTAQRNRQSEAQARCKFALKDWSR
jgi:hypothetical protein